MNNYRNYRKGTSNYRCVMMMKEDVVVDVDDDDDDNDNDDEVT